MQEHEYEVLKIRASIAPAAETWPHPDPSKTTLGGPDDMPSMDPVAAHWGAIHSAVDFARDKTMRALGEMAGVDDDKTLSPAGKAEQKKDIATKALASFEKAPHLGRARSAIEALLPKWDKACGVIPEQPTSVSASVQLSEIRAHIAALKEIDRVNFVTKHSGDPRVVTAVLGAPAFLSGLSDDEIAIARREIAKRVNAEAFAARDEATKALSQVEAGCRTARRQIATAGGLDLSHDGAASS